MNVTKSDPLPSAPLSATAAPAVAAKPAAPALAAQVTQFQRAMLKSQPASTGGSPSLGLTEPSLQADTAVAFDPGVVRRHVTSTATPQPTQTSVNAGPRFDPVTGLLARLSSGDRSQPPLPNAVPLDGSTAPTGELARKDPDDEPATASSDETCETLGAAMLQSLLTQSSQAPATGLISTVPPAPRLQSLESIVAETVSRVLVSDPLHDGRREVRIEFAREVLPDTSVRLWRAEGRLHVEFTSAPAVADSGLKEALPRLGDAIQLRQAEPVAPVVTLRLHRSDTDGQPGDGRSRQRYRPQDEIEELA